MKEEDKSNKDKIIKLKKYLFIGLFIFSLIFIFSYLQKNANGYFVKGPDLNYPKGSEYSLLKLKTGKILVLGMNYTQVGKRTFVHSELFDPVTNKFSIVNIEPNLQYLPSAIVLKNGKILLTCVSEDRMAILNPNTFRLENFLNLKTKGRNYQRYVTEINEGNILVVGGVPKPKSTKVVKGILSFEYMPNEKTFNAEIYSTKTGQLIKTIKISKNIFSHPNVYNSDPIFKMQNNNYFVSAMVSKDNILLDTKNAKYSKIPDLTPSNSVYPIQINDDEIILFEWNYDGLFIKRFNLFNKGYITLDKFEHDKFPLRQIGEINLVKVSNSKILITGGCRFLDIFHIFRKMTSEAYLYDFESRKLQKIQNMKAERVGHKSIVLNDGRVLIIGNKLLPTIKTEFFISKERYK